MIGHLRSQRTAKLQIFTSWSLSAPTVDVIHGEDIVCSTLFWSSNGPFFHHPHRGGLGRYDSLWLVRVPRTLAYRDAGSSVFEPAQAFRFGSLDFIADRLDVLHLHKEARDPAPVGGTSSIDSRTRDFDGAASALHSEQTVCSNPTVSNTRTFIRPLFTISHRSLGGTALPTPQTPYSRFPYGLASSADAYARGL